MGIDLGDTCIRAAVARAGEHSEAAAHVVRLDADGGPPQPEHDGSISTALHLGPDGSVLVGRAAEAMVERDPRRVTRGFVSRVGDVVPVVLPEGPYPAEILVATVVGWVADEVAAVEGTGPERIAVTHPPHWGTHRCGALHAALEDAGLPGVLLIPSAVAAAHAYAQCEHVGADAVLGFGRIGRAHFDAALLRATTSGFDLLSAAGRSPSQPGMRIDDLLLRHALGKAGHEKPESADLPGRVLARLRAECEHAKRRLSVERQAVLPVPGPGRGETIQVELGRAEFERLAKPVLRTMLDALRHTVGAVGTADPAAVLVSGGTARIPLVRELGGTLLGDKIVVDDDHSSTLCRGAALAARGGSAPMDRPAGNADSAPEGTSTALVGYGRREQAVAAYDGDPIGPAPDRPPIEVTTLDPPKRKPKLRFGRAESSRRKQEES